MRDDAADLTLAQALRMLVQGWATIAISAAAFTGVAVALAILWKPVYSGQVLLAPAGADDTRATALSRITGELGPIADLMGGGGSNEGFDSKEVRLATLRSRRLTEAFIGDRNLLPTLFPERWDAERQRWKVKDGKPFIPTMGDAVSLFDNKIRRMNEDRRTGLITLSIEWGDPQQAADWANDLVARTNDFLRTRAKDEAARSIAFLEGELQKTTVVERRQIIYRLIESKTSQIMMANARSEYAFVIVDPAVPADAGHFIRPKRLMVIATGTALGLLVGGLYVLIRRSRELDSALLRTQPTQ